jgi:hypothetical protein
MNKTPTHLIKIDNNKKLSKEDNELLLKYFRQFFKPTRREEIINFVSDQLKKEEKKNV